VSALVPKGWERHELGDVVTFKSGGTPNRATVEFWGGDIPWVSAKDLKAFDLRDSIERLTSLGAAQVNTVPPDTVLILVRGMGLFKDFPIGITSRVMAFNQDVKALIPRSEINSRFLAYALMAMRSAIMGRVDKSGHGTGRLSTDYLAALPITFPPLPEQRRIVAVLDTCNQAIDQTERLITAKQRRYRGLITHHLFGPRQSIGKGLSQTAKRVARSKSWPLGAIGDFARDVSRYNRPAENLPVLSCTKHAGIVLSDEYFGGRRIYSKDTSGYKLVERGQFAYATNHLEEGSIGLQEIVDSGLVSPMYTVFETDDRLVDRHFLISVLKTETYRQVFEMNTSSSVDRRGGLRWDEFAALPFALPPLQEQKRLASAIAALEADLAGTTAKANALRIQKRGMMHKLLTGQWVLDEHFDPPALAPQPALAGGAA
jgi:type I restriction enzyme, S subunit